MKKKINRIAIVVIIYTFTSVSFASELFFYCGFNNQDELLYDEIIEAEYEGNPIKGTGLNGAAKTKGIEAGAMLFTNTASRQCASVVFNNVSGFLSSFEEGPFTISLFFKPHEQGNLTHEIIGNAFGERGPGWRLNYSWKNVQFVSGDGEKFWMYSFSADAGKIIYDQWNHIVVIRNEKGIISGYLNGKKSANGSGIYTVTAGTPDLSVGSYKGGYAYGTLGAVDEIKIYQGVLSEKEILKEMAKCRECGVEPPPPVIPLPLTEGFEITPARPEKEIRKLWTKWEHGFIITNDRPYEGKYCALVTNGAGVLTINGGFAPGDYFTLSFYVRSDPHDGPAYRNCFYVWSYSELRGQGQELKMGSLIIPFAPGKDWTKYEEQFTVTPNTKSIVMRFNKYGGHSGTTWIDNIKINVVRVKDTAGFSAPPQTVSNFTYIGNHRKFQGKHPQITNFVHTNMQSESYMNEIKPLLSMNDVQISAAMPVQAGIFFVDCPNCTLQGQGSSFTWSISDPHRMSCTPCGHVFPSEKYPSDKKQIVTAPSGKKIEYKYHQDAKGWKYYLDAGIAFRQKAYFERAAWILGNLYALTGNEAYAEKAALILVHFVKAFPDFVFKYDMVKAPVEFFIGLDDPGIVKRQDRASRWDWWAYMDISRSLLLVYDCIYDSTSLEAQLKKSGLDRRLHIEKGFFHQAAEIIFKNNIETYGNMSPDFWQRAIIAGRITGAPDYVHIAIERFKYYMKSQFMFDGFWFEPSVSYFEQSAASALWKVSMASSGYSDPDGFNSAYSSIRYTNLNPAENLGENVKIINQASALPYYPDGRPIPLGDSWMWPVPAAGKPEQVSYYFPALGHSALTGITNGKQVQLHMNWTPKTGHWQHDTLGITIWAHNREVLSDLGYSHTKYRTWMGASASHNTVVVDFKNQEPGVDKGRGDVIYVDNTQSGVQITDADGRKMNHGNLYRRTVFLIHKGQGRYYTADFFSAGGGSVYDYFLHGNADKEDAVEFSGSGGTPLSRQDAELVPADTLKNFIEPKSEYDFAAQPQYHAYWFLKETEQVKIPSDGFVRTIFRADDGYGTAAFTPFEKKDSPLFFTGRNPSVRQAGKDDNTLADKFFRKFLLVRLKSSADVHFANIIEPFHKEPNVAVVKYIAPGILIAEYRQAAGSVDSDIIFCRRNSPGTVTVQNLSVTVEGAYGYVSVRDSKIHAYHIVNGTVRCGSETIQSGPELTIPIDRAVDTATIKLTRRAIINFSGQPGTAPFVRINHGNGQTHGYFIEKVSKDQTLVTVKGQLGFTILDTQPKLTRFYTYPATTIQGENSMTFFSVAVKN